MTKRLCPGRPRRATSRQDWGEWGHHLRQPVEHVAWWHARSHDEVMKRCVCVNLRLMTLGVRRDAVVREIQVTRLRAESPHPPGCPSNTTRVKRRLFRWHQLAVSWEVRLRVSARQGFGWRTSSDLGSVWRGGDRR